MEACCSAAHSIESTQKPDMDNNALQIFPYSITGRAMTPFTSWSWLKNKEEPSNVTKAGAG